MKLDRVQQPVVRRRSEMRLSRVESNLESVNPACIRQPNVSSGTAAISISPEQATAYLPRDDACRSEANAIQTTVATAAACQTKWTSIQPTASIQMRSASAGDRRPFISDPFPTCRAIPGFHAIHWVSIALPIAPASQAVEPIRRRPFSSGRARSAAVSSVAKRLPSRHGRAASRLDAAIPRRSSTKIFVDLADSQSWRSSGTARSAARVHPLFQDTPREVADGTELCDP